MFEKELETLQSVYDQLKDRYDLVLTNAFALKEGFTVDCPIIVGKDHGQIVELYMQGEEFIFVVMDEAQTKGMHGHPLDVETAVEDIAEFMNGREDYKLWPFPAYR